MPRPLILTDEQWIKEFQRARSSTLVMARNTGLDIRTIQRRRKRLEAAGHNLQVTDPMMNTDIDYIKRNKITVKDGIVIIFSDAHWWPGREITPANKALLALCKRLNPAVVIANGDVLDAPTISRHEPDGWKNTPPLHRELDELKIRMREIIEASPGAKHLRTIGNHDIRFDRKLANLVPDYRHLQGMMLRHHLPDWQESMSVEINGSIIVKHRWHTSIHGIYHNVLKGGRTIVTGHMHKLQITPWTDYNGRRFGIDCGTIADIDGPQFEYDEDVPKTWGAGFVVLTFRNGVMMPPEICEVLGESAYFRGEVVYEKAKNPRANKRVSKAPARTSNKKRIGVRKVRA